jgi:TPR repeat protein
MSSEELMQKAEAGDVEAQFRIGARYDSGDRVPRDGAEAVRWYRRAAEAGHANAQNSMGSILQAEKHYEQARPWYEHAAAQGHAQAINNLAYLYDLGLGTTQDRRKAFDLYSRAADLAWAEAMWNLANMYGAGQLEKKDLDMSCVWTFRALRFVPPNSEPRFAQAYRVANAFERNFKPERLSACKQKAESWKPPALQSGTDAQQGPAGDAAKAARP